MDRTALTLTIIGALNWALVGIFQFAVMITYIAAVIKRNKTVLSRPAAPEEQNAVR